MAWEPVVEPSRLSTRVDWNPFYSVGGQAVASAQSQMSIMLTDKMEDTFVPARRTSESGFSQNGSSTIRPLAINITDAAAMVLARTLQSFNEIRSEIEHVSMQSQGETGRDIDNPESGSAASTSDKKHEFTLPNHTSLNSSTQLPASLDRRLRQSMKAFEIRNRCGMGLSFFRSDDAVVNEESDEFPSHTTAVEEGQSVLFRSDLSGSIRTDGTPDIFGDRSNGNDQTVPSVTVLFDSRSSTVNVHPLRGLKLLEVGSFIHTLIVERLISQDGAVFRFRFALPVLWEVDVVDNRRVLTISSGIQIVSLLKERAVNVGWAAQGAESTITDLGSVTAGVPFHLPLWLSLRCQECAIFVRPADRSWSNTGVLRFQRQISESNGEGDVSGQVWFWSATFGATTTRVFREVVRTAHDSTSIGSPEPALAFVCVRSVTQGVQQRYSQPTVFTDPVVSLIIDSMITVQNMLPIPVEIEATGSVAREDRSGANSDQDSHCDNHLPVAKHHLPTGQCVDVLGTFVDKATPVLLRLRLQGCERWTTWVDIDGTHSSNNESGEYTFRWRIVVFPKAKCS